MADMNFVAREEIAPGVGNRSRLRLAGILLGLIATAYLGLAITVIDYQPPGLGPIFAGVMITAGLFGLVVAWRTARGAPGRTPPVAAAAVLGGLPFAALTFELCSWIAQRDGFERAQDKGANGRLVFEATPGPLLDMIVVPGSLIAAAIIVIAVVMAPTPRRDVPLIVLGTFMALAVPAAMAGFAALWSGGVIDPDPNGDLIQTLQMLGLPGLVVSPIGLVLALWGANVRGAGRWAAFLLWGVPLLAVLWFFSAVWLGGLAGEPF